MKQTPLLRFRPFGGLEKIGSNISLIEYQDKIVAIDCGIQFPQDDLLGIRYLFPNISEIEKIDALIITHGHEDHIGGIIQFLRQFPNCPVYCSSFSKELILGKLAYKKMSANFEHYLPGDTLFLDDLEIKTIPVNHSIPETQGLHFTNSKKEFSLLFMSDFKIERDSSYEKTFSIKNFPELTEKYPIKIALLDSTNILVEKRKHSEFDVENNIEKIFGQFNQRIYITTFASNLYRLISFIKLAKKFKRKVLLKGPSFHRYLDCAVRSGLIKESDFKGTLINDEKRPPSNCIIIISGCQADKRSSLSNLVNQPNNSLVPRKGDLFIFSSKAIPGNERAVANIIDELSRLGVHILNDRHGFHCSGHADQEDLKEVYTDYAPTHAIPIHGNVYFLNKHIEFIQENFKSITCAQLLNKDEFVINHQFELTTKLNNNSKDISFFHGSNEIEIDSQTLGERKRIARDGVVSIVLKSSRNKVMGIETMGIPMTSIDLKKELPEIIEEHSFKTKNFEQELRSLTNNFFSLNYGVRPKLIIHLV